MAALREELVTGAPIHLGEHRALLRRRFPELAALAYAPAGMVQGHPETALRHTERVLARVQSWLKDLPPDQAQALYLAALLHDLGRGVVEPGRAAARYQHAAAPLARDVLYRLQVPPPLRDHVVYLVRHKARPATFGRRQAELAPMLRLAWTLNTRLLYLLAQADCLARDLPPADRRCRSIAAFRARCQELGVFGREPPPLLSPERWAQLTPADPWLARRVAGELRFWRLKGEIETPPQAEAWLAAQRPTPAGTLYLPVGVPASGKSTWVGQHLPAAEVVSMDEMRERLTGDRRDQSQNPLVYRRCLADLRRALAAGHTVVWDAQSHTWRARKGLLAVARDEHAYVVIVYFDVPLPVALQRNLHRQAVVPPAVIVRSYEDLEEPRPFEAEELWRIDVDGHCTRCVASEGAGA